MENPTDLGIISLSVKLSISKEIVKSSFSGRGLTIFEFREKLLKRYHLCIGVGQGRHE